MTAIVIWFNQENPKHHSVWVAADTLVSSGNGPLIADAAKILPLQVVCRQPDDSGFFAKPYYANSLGFCFSGSTLMGQNSYLGLTPLLSNLACHEPRIPSLDDIAAYVLAYLSLSFDEYKVRVGSNAMFEASLFGYCPVQENFSIHHFFPKIVDGTYIIVHAVRHCEDGKKNFLYLGDQKKSMEELLRANFEKEPVPGRPMWRSPRHVIDDVIENPDLPTIGGDLQFGIAGKTGFAPMTICRPRKKGKPEAYFSYLGRELTPELSRVGPTMVAIAGMA